MKACSQQKEKVEVFLPRMLLSYWTIPHTGRLESPSALMGRQIRALLTMSYSTSEKMWYKKSKVADTEGAEFIMQKGHNTAIINRENGDSVLAHADQIRTQGEEEERNDEEMSVSSDNELVEQPLQKETSEETMQGEEGQKDSENSDEDQSMQEDTCDYSLDRDRSRSPRKRNTGEREREQFEENIRRRSTRATRGIKE